jgi:hypothetical protein
MFYATSAPFDWWLLPILDMSDKKFALSYRGVIRVVLPKAMAKKPYFLH